MNAQIVEQLPLFSEPVVACAQPGKSSTSSNLRRAWLHPEHLPSYITQSPTIMRVLDLLGPLDWEHFPERDLKPGFGFPPIPYAAVAAAELIKLNEGLRGLKQLRLFLSEHLGFISLLNFSAHHQFNSGFSFNTPPPASCLPTQRHLTRMLREMPNDALQFLMADSVVLIRDELARRGIVIGECISLDTKHILAWVQQNNPKAYVAERFTKNKQPAGDPDCRLGCKRRRNVPEAQAPGIGHTEHTKHTPTTKPVTAKPVTAKGVSMGEFYWGYGSGIVVTKVPGCGEFVLAEMTQPFDHGDLTYFFPLMRQAEQRLGFKPHFGTFVRNG